MPDDKFITMLKDIGGIKPDTSDPFAHWDDKTQCPYCPRRFKSLTALDTHCAYVHGGKEV